MKFQREQLTLELLNEAFPLLEKHYAEVAHYKDIPLDPDFERYLQVDKSGNIRAFTARDDLGVLIGYAVYFIHQNMHYRSSKQAVQDVIYIDPARRGFGAKFISWCDAELLADGVQVVYQHIKAAHDFGPMLKRLGYELVDLIYARRLS